MRLTRKYKMYAMFPCILVAYFTLLRPFSNRLLAKINGQLGSGGGVQDVIYENKEMKTYVSQKNLSVVNVSNFQRKIINITLKPETARFLNSKDKFYAMTRDAPYLIENRNLCNTIGQLSVVVMVHTAPRNFDNRMAIRKTWANNSYYLELGTVRTLFLLGRANNESLQMEIEREFKEHGDIVQGDFIDSYYNMTLKGVMGYKWLSERCKNAKIILKVDDDVIINMFSFLKDFAPVFLSKNKHMACRRLPRARIDRTKGSKWVVSNELFKRQRFYPPFCQGFMVTISNDVVSELFTSSSVTPFFWIDDVYLYGLVPGNVPGMTYTDLVYGKRVIWGADKGSNCLKRKNCQYLVILLWSDIPVMMRELWTLMQKNYIAETK